MTRRPSDETAGGQRLRVLSARAIWLAGALLAGVGAVAAAGLLWAFGGGTSRDQSRLEAIKTAGTIVVGTGGAAALLLAARRQRGAEIELVQKDQTHALQARVADAAEVDAAARRVTELYAKSVESLGSDTAPVRLGGLYALERLGQDNVDQRQTIVNVVCSYLRMLYQVQHDPSEDAGPEAWAAHHDRMRELQVRLTAQRILRAHLRPGGSADRPTAAFWRDIDLDLSQATLIRFDLSDCTVRTCQFPWARFFGLANLRGTRFNGDAEFFNTHFFDTAKFGGAVFAAETDFRGVAFDSAPNFSGLPSFDGDERRAPAKFLRGVPKQIDSLGAVADA